MSQRVRVGLAGVATAVALVWLAVAAWGGRDTGATEAAEDGPTATTVSPAVDSGSGSAATTTTSLDLSSEVADPAGVTLPPGAVGEFSADPGSGVVVGSGPVRTFDVEAEAATGVDPARFAAVVDSILADQRSWIGDGSMGFQRVPADGSFTVTLATPATTDQLCAPLNTIGQLSCRQGSRVIINLTRWLEGTTDWDGLLADYRAMVINHEVGHVLGHGHLECPGVGELAPVMMQQTLGLDGCVGNPWVFPGP